jgi:aerobic-type carbon monoxide dehydrogenase small subunit (CoxS/CutS family)
MAIRFELNGKSTTVDVDPQMPLLWVLRDTLNLTGTKYGCGIAACGACTVHINGVAQRSCVYPIAAVSGKKVTTIEGLSSDRSHPVQQAWIAEQVPQCGYCQSGQIMTAVSFLKKIRIPLRPTWIGQCPTIFAGAGQISEFEKRFYGPRQL